MAKKPRRDQARPVNSYGNPDWSAMTHCPACGKKTYETRKSAKNAAKAHHPGEHMSVYRCRSKSPKRPNPAPWHYGHLDEKVIAGEVTKEERYETGPIKVYRPDKKVIEAINIINSATNSPR